MANAVFSIPIADRVRAVSSVYGKIEQILLVIDGGYRDFEIERIGLFYKELFERFSDRVAFMVMGHFPTEAEESLRNTLRQNGLPSELALVHTPLSSCEDAEFRHVHGAFVQDPFLVMQSNLGETLLLESYRPSLQQNAFLARQLADATGYGLLATRLSLEGGNVLVGDDYALIGRNLLERNRLDLYPHLPVPEAESLITAEFKRRLGMRYIVWIGEQEEVDHPLRPQWAGPEALQPFYHLDMFLTLAGKTPTGDELVLLAHIDPSSFDSKPDPEQMDAIHRLDDLLRRTAGQLLTYSQERPGPRFQVVEIPMSGNIAGAGAGLDFTPYSYSNAQVESYEGIRRIYLPAFPCRRALEERLREQLHALGFSRVDYVRYDFEQFARRRGGLHCLTKVLRRGG